MINLQTAIMCFISGAFTLHFSYTNHLHVAYIILGIIYILYLFLQSLSLIETSQNVETVQVEENAKDEGIEQSFYFMFAPWCMHSKKARPMWDDLNSLYSSDEEISFSLINSEDTEKREILEHYKVESFPTFIYHVDGFDPVTYHGPRTVEKLSEFIESHRV